MEILETRPRFAQTFNGRGPCSAQTLTGQSASCQFVQPSNRAESGIVTRHRKQIEASIHARHENRDSSIPLRNEAASLFTLRDPNLARGSSLFSTSACTARSHSDAIRIVSHSHLHRNTHSCPGGGQVSVLNKEGTDLYRVANINQDPPARPLNPFFCPRARAVGSHTCGAPIVFEVATPRHSCD